MGRKTLFDTNVTLQLNKTNRSRKIVIFFLTTLMILIIILTYFLHFIINFYINYKEQVI